MESINPTQAAQVWQRVRGNPPEEPTLEKLLALEAECRRILGVLHRNTPLRDNPLLLRLREDSGRLCHILLGLAMLREADVTVTAPPAVRGNPEGLIRQCHATRQKSIALLDALSPEDRAALKPLMDAQLLYLLELLGSLPRK